MFSPVKSNVLKIKKKTQHVIWSNLCAVELISSQNISFTGLTFWNSYLDFLMLNNFKTFLWIRNLEITRFFPSTTFVHFIYNYSFFLIRDFVNTGSDLDLKSSNYHNKKLAAIFSKIFWYSWERVWRKFSKKT